MSTCYRQVLFSTVDELEASASRRCQLCAKIWCSWYTRRLQTPGGRSETSSQDCVVLQLTVWNTRSGIKTSSHTSSDVQAKAYEESPGDISVQICPEGVIAQLDVHDSHWVVVGYLYLNIDDDIHNILREISEMEDQHTGSDSSLILASVWLQKCLSEHPCPKASDDAPLPSRLIDVGYSDGNQEPRLVETDGTKGQYIALSHCWEKPSECHPLTTITATLADRKASIPFTTLPQTFQHSITIARKLSIRYLWIDSLCIYSNRSTMKDLGILRFAPQFSEEFNFYAFS